MYLPVGIKISTRLDMRPSTLRRGAAACAAGDELRAEVAWRPMPFRLNGMVLSAAPQAARISDGWRATGGNDHQLNAETRASTPLAR